MGKANYYAKGQWNFYCDLCGAKTKSGDGRKTWDNQWVCRHHKEVRNPQDFVRGVRDDQTTPWSRTEGPLDFVEVCTLRGSNAIPGYAVPGCAFPANSNLIFIAEGFPSGQLLNNPNHPPDRFNDLTYVYDSLQPVITRVQSTIPGHTTEFFLMITP